MSSISTRLDEAMREARYRSQSELARKSNVPQATISRILSNGGTKGPETETLRKLAAACGVTLAWLTEGAGPKYPGLPNADLHQLPTTLPDDKPFVSGEPCIEIASDRHRLIQQITEQLAHLPNEKLKALAVLIDATL